jgi:hypothetical protein
VIVAERGQLFLGPLARLLGLPCMPQALIHLIRSLAPLVYVRRSSLFLL